MISERIKKIKPSATLEITAKAKTIKDVVNLSAGEPDFDTPEHIKTALYDAVKKGFVYYTPTPGLIGLRKAIARKLSENGLKYDPEKEIIATPGAKQALYEAIMAVTNPMDEVLIPDPYWVSYVPMVQIAGGKPCFIPTREENGFELLPEYVENKITNRTKALILNSPNNPTGCVLSKKNLHKISEICKENKILVISDEIYEPITYRVEHCSIASFDGMKDITVVVNGFSKAYSMTGWRLGYAAGPEKIIKAMTRIQAHSVSNPTSFVQVAGEVALKSSQACVKKMVDEFRKRRDVMLKMLNEIDKVSCVEPKGTFYAFPNFSYYEKNSLKLANYFLESARVAVVPGEAFGDQGKGFMRLSYATSMENIVEGMERIKRALKKLR